MTTNAMEVNMTKWFQLDMKTKHTVTWLDMAVLLAKHDDDFVDMCNGMPLSLIHI